MREPMSGRFNFAAVGSPCTPAAQIVTSDGIEVPSLIRISVGSIAATAVLSRIFTPSFSRSFLVRAERLSEKLGNNRGPASIR